MKKYSRTFSVFDLAQLIKIHPWNLINSMYLAPNYFQKYNYNQPFLANDYIHFLNQQIKTDNNINEVLIIDDDEDFYLYLSSIFRKKGFNTHWAKNGLEASYYIVKHGPLIITLDLKMKTMDGHQLLDVLGRVQNIKSPWIIIISGDNQDEIENGIKEGADFYFKKPIQNNELIKVISKIQKNN